MFGFIVITLLNKMSFVKSIMGGSNVTIEEVPYQVGYGDICSGVIVGRKHVLTAAHCGKSINYITVASNIYKKGHKVKIKAHKVHPNFGYEKHQFDYDIQILELYNRLHYSKQLRNIDIFNGSIDEVKTINISGWGYPKEGGDYHTILQQVQLDVISLNMCQKINTTKYYNHTLTSRMFCADGYGLKDACQGDSGGPAVSSGYLIGISSFGYGCGRVAGVYTNILNNNITKWLQKHVNSTQAVFGH